MSDSLTAICSLVGGPAGLNAMVFKHALNQDPPAVIRKVARVRRAQIERARPKPTHIRGLLKHNSNADPRNVQHALRQAVEHGLNRRVKDLARRCCAKLNTELVRLRSHNAHVHLAHLCASNAQFRPRLKQKAWIEERVEVIDAVITRGSRRDLASNYGARERHLQILNPILPTFMPDAQRPLIVVMDEDDLERRPMRPPADLAA